MNMTAPDSTLAAKPARTTDPDMNEAFDLFPFPTLIVSPSHRVQRVSGALVEAWGRGRGEFIGKDLFIALYKDSATERFDRILLAHAIETAISGRGLRLCHAAYTAHDACWSARVIPVFRKDELLCLVLEWEQVEIPLGPADGGLTQGWLSVDEAFRILVQTVKDYAIFLLDTRGNVATWNTGAELHKGYRREDIVGKHFSVFYGEEDLQARKPEKELEICLREGRVEDEGWRYRKDGSRFWANVIITAVYKNGVHVGFGKVTRDLTDRKAADLRLTAAYEESTKLKNDFLANISHEIRTPMHGMLSACSLLLDTPLTDTQRETANIIEDSGQVLLQVINDILDYSKLSSCNFSINPGVVRVADIITSVVRSVRTTLQPGVQLELVLAPDLPESAQGDPLRYRQIVQNIVGNAGKFTEKGSISVRASLLAEDETTYMILIQVSDTGIGVSEAAARNLFKPFTQLDSTFKKRYQGTGLGLSIAKSLAELMDGQMGYRPNHGQGSIFWFSGKLKKIKSPQPNHAGEGQPGAGSKISRQMSASAEGVDPSLKQLQEIAPTKRILAVEDNLINQKVLVGMLHVFGFKDIAVAGDGAQAVSMLSSSPNTYDLVLMDISMPVMDGHEATTQIRSMGIHLPVIAMTAYALKGDLELCLEKGMDDYIAKPMDRQLLLKKLLTWLARPIKFDADPQHPLVHEDSARSHSVTAIKN